VIVRGVAGRDRLVLRFWSGRHAVKMSLILDKGEKKETLEGYKRLSCDMYYSSAHAGPALASANSFIVQPSL
jgi:hypothetical protein